MPYRKIAAKDDREYKKIEEAMRTSREYLSLAMELAHLGPWKYDPETNQFEFGDEFYAIYGTNMSREGRFMASDVYAREFVHPDDAWIVSAVVTKALASTERKFSTQLEHRIIRRDGEVRTIVVRINLIKDINGKIVNWYGANQDITDQVEALEKAQRQKEYLASLHEISIGLLNRLDLTDLLNAIVIRICKLFGTPDGYICLVNESRGTLERKIGSGRYANLIGQELRMNDGLNGKVIQSGQPLVIQDYRNWPGRHPDSIVDTLQTAVGIPLKSGEKVIGVICLNYFDLPRSFSAEEVELFSRFAELASIALVNASLYSSLNNSEKELQQKNADLTATHEELIASEEELRQQFDELIINEEKIVRQNMVLTSLHETALGLMHRLDLNEVLTMIASCATELLGIPDGWISMVDEEKGVIVSKIALGNSARYMAKQINLSEGKLAGKVYFTGQIAFVNDYSNWEHRLPDSIFDGQRCVVIVPLKIKDKVVGLFGLTSYEEGRTIADHELALLQRFAELASIALDNATLFTSYKNELQERRQTEEALRMSENRYKNLYVEFEQKQALLVSLINSIPDLIFYKDKNSVYLGCNKAFEVFAGMKEQELVGLTDLDIFNNKEMAEFFRQKDLEMMQKGEPRRNEELVQYPDGKQVLLDTLKTPYYDPQGDNLGLIGISRDITERKKKEEEILFLSYNDVLTGLYNRTYFEESMKRLEAVHDASAGLMVCDVDGLKIINDTLGHNTGDIILKSVAKILRNSFRTEDLVARIGGDEFAVLLHHNSDQVFEAHCRKIRQQIDLYNIENPTIPISLSIGFAVSRATPVDMNALFKEADNNMYREKLHHHKSSRSAIVQTLMKALEVRDFQTEGHGERLQELITSFAIALELPEKDIGDLRLLARFHDIGKVGIPDSILFKPGKLTEEEYAVMRQHCEIGYRIALSAPDLAPIADWILKHQEWWNGNGYPLQIRGEEIPFECRIVAIADAYDAMTSDRPYRKAMSHEAAINELKRCAGTQFDPELVMKFDNLKK